MAVIDAAGPSADSGALAPPRGAGVRVDWVWIAAGLAIAVCAAPAAAVLLAGLGVGGGPVSAPFWEEALFWRGLTGTAMTLAVGGGGALVLGAVAAWLVTMCAFPGRALFSWALVLPLAAPAYVLAFAYSGLSWRDGPFPVPVEGALGASFVFALAFYPYVFVAGRGAFMSQSVCALEAARALGAGPWRMTLKVAAPLAWPGLAAGLMLALMEISADYGAAAYLGAETVTTGVFRAWFARAEPQLAMQLSSLLLLGAVALMGLERAWRGRRGYAGGSTRWRALPRFQLRGVAALGATAFCSALLFLALILPLGWLARHAILRGAQDLPRLVDPLVHSLILAGLGAAITLALATALAVAARRGGALGKTASFAAGAGYAAPGAVLALGALSVFGFAREMGLVGGLAGGVAFGALLWAYAARFAAPGAQPIEAGMTRVSGSIAAAARSLGCTPLARLLRVELPIAAPSVAAAALIVFVETLKELPATLILRPFDFDTLAVTAYQYASDERLTQAAAPALLIVLAGVAPVLLLSARIAKGRAGAR